VFCLRWLASLVLMRSACRAVVVLSAASSMVKAFGEESLIGLVNYAVVATGAMPRNGK
jgi:hypothetical protein